MTRRSFTKLVGVAALSAALLSAGYGCAKEEDYDVIVVGAGVIGACTARELARYDGSVLVLEAGLDLACGATRANSGIVHVGYDPKPGTLKAHYNVEGAALFPQWQAELGFGYRVNGALVLAFSDEEKATLKKLRKRGEGNGVKDLSLIDAKELRKLEPSVSDDAVAALSVPGSAICDPYGLTYGAAENAADNGIEFLFGRKVTNITPEGDGYRVEVNEGEASYRARAVVNAAGIRSDTINNLVSKKKLSITPRRGEYLLYENTLEGAFSHTMLQVPSEAGKGVLVSPTIFGNQFCGPNSVKMKSRTNVSTTTAGLEAVLDSAKRIWPKASDDGVIASYAGLRASGGDDFVIGEAEDAPRFFNAACIDSPGLASAPAIAEDLAIQVAERLGLGENVKFDPVRQAPALFAHLDNTTRANLVDIKEAYGHLVCRCCAVTEGEVVDALNRSIPVLSLDALKWRLGIMMGPCHGGRCTAELMAIVARELQLEPEDVPLKRTEGSALVQVDEQADDAQADAEKQAADAEASESEKKPTIPEACEVLVVGGGVAGRSAAIAAAGKGKDVLLLAGSPKAVPLIESWFWKAYDAGTSAEDVDHEEHARATLEEAGVTALFDATAFELSRSEEPEGFNVVCVGTAGMRQIFAKAVVLATGVYEEGTGSSGIVGSRPAGVYSAEETLGLLSQPGTLPGLKAVVYGSSDLAMLTALQLQEAGVKVNSIVEPGKEPACSSEYVDAAEKASLRIRCSTRVVNVGGKSRVDLVDLLTQIPMEGNASVPEGLEASGATTDSAGYLVSAEASMSDLVVVSLDLRPDTAVGRPLGLRLNKHGGFETHGERMTSVNGVFACGNVRKPHGSLSDALADGEKAGVAAAAWASRSRKVTDPQDEVPLATS